MSRALIVCPASPDRTRTITASRWGMCPTGMTARFLERRERSIHQYRSAGEPVVAERYGWLTIAGLWASLGPQATLNLDPAGQLDFTGSLIAPPGQTQPNSRATIPNTGLTAADPRDSFGLWLADLAADAATRAVVTVNDSPLSSAIVIDALTRILMKT